MRHEVELLTLAGDAIVFARSAGADFADIAISSGRHISVAVEAGNVRTAEQHEQAGWSVRAFVGGGMGGASGDGLPDRRRLRAQVEQAVEMARLAGPDPDFRDLPGPQPPLRSDSELALFDPAIDGLALADAVRLAADCIEQVRSIDPGVSLSGEVSFAGGAAVLVSSTGVAVATPATFGEVSLFAVARDGDDVGSFSEYTMGRHMSDLAIEPLAGKVVAGARRYQHARPGPSRTMPLVMGPLAALSLLGAVAAATSAEAIRRKRSLLAGRLGQVVASPALTLLDRPLEPRGVHSGAFDGEGSPRLPVTMIERGVFAEPLTNHYNARLAGVRNNGHGARSMSISPSNLHVGLGTRTEADLIREVDDGVYLEAGSLDPDLAGGDFSAVLDFARKIDRGRLTYPLAGTMAAGNLLDLLAGIDAVSSDFRPDPGMVLPAIRVSSVQFSGAG